MPPTEQNPGQNMACVTSIPQHGMHTTGWAAGGTYATLAVEGARHYGFQRTEATI